MLEGGVTPLLSPEELRAMGFHLVAYPLTLLASAAFAMRQAVMDLQAGKTPERMLSFSDLKALVNFDAYDDTVGKRVH
jgi:2-methylisocitrate lyase-like PEP mutase family enzyme